MEEKLKILIKYHDDHLGGAIARIEKLSIGDWIDLRCAERSIDLFKGDSVLIPLGVSMKLPEGYEATYCPSLFYLQKMGDNNDKFNWNH